jgi:hypothetical protein
VLERNTEFPVGCGVQRVLNKGVRKVKKNSLEHYFLSTGCVSWLHPKVCGTERWKKHFTMEKLTSTTWPKDQGQHHQCKSGWAVAQWYTPVSQVWGPEFHPQHLKNQQHKGGISWSERIPSRWYNFMIIICLPRWSSSPKPRIMRKTLDKSQRRGHLQNTWPIFLKVAKTTKNQECLTQLQAWEAMTANCNAETWTEKIRWHLRKFTPDTGGSHL